MATSSSLVQVRQATHDDIPQIVTIQFSAFEGDPYQEALFPGDYYSEQVRRGACERTRAYFDSDPTARWLVTEPSPLLTPPTPPQQTSSSTPSKPVATGFAHWNVYAHPRAESEWRRDPQVTWCTGRAQEIALNFLRMNQRLRERIWAGRPYVLLNLLCVHQDHQRQGAGTALVQWGMRLADELGLPIHIEASPAGYELYLKLGFRQVATAVVTAEEFDGDHDRPYIAMVRQPVGSPPTEMGISPEDGIVV